MLLSDWLLNASATGNAHLRDGSDVIIVRAATLKYELDIKVIISPSHSTLTCGQQVQALTRQFQAPKMEVSKVGFFYYFFKSLGRRFERSQKSIIKNAGNNTFFRKAGGLDKIPFSCIKKQSLYLSPLQSVQVVNLKHAEQQE